MQVPDLTPGPGEVLLDVAASAVNRADLMQRQGFYPPPPGASEILGLECSGTVAAVADGVEQRGGSADQAAGQGAVRLGVGDQVCALLAGGGYAEQVVVPAGQCLPIPAGVDLISAAALPEVACTVHANLIMTARLKAGETLLIHGGGSGIGTFAIQYAVALGVRVAVTAGSQDKLERCRELGAQVLINYREQDFVEVLGQADVVLDNMGAKYLARNVDVLAPNGRLVVIGLQGGTTAELNLGQLLGKRGTVHAASLRVRPAAEKAAICAEVADRVWPLITAGQIRPIIDRVVPLPEAAQAHRLVTDSEHVGKVVLRVPR